MTPTLLLTALLTAGQTLSPADAVALAASDAVKLPQWDAPFQRYLWIHQPTDKTIGAMSYTLNTAHSHATTLYYPAVLSKSLIRVDLRRLAPQEKDFKRLHQLWEFLADSDPYFHHRIEKVVTVAPYKQDGKTWTGKRVVQSEPAISTGLDKHLFLVSLTQSNAPILRADWLLVKSLTTLGGYYYEFRGIEDLNQAQWLALAGANEKQIQEVFRSDERAAMFRSGVTGKPRRIDMFPGTAVRLTTGTNLISITRDLTDEDNEAAKDPFQNLIVFNDAAREAFRFLKNGMREGTLWNNKGVIQRSVPDNIARDHSIPSPHTGRLQSMISCIRCHGPEDMVQTFTNQVQDLLKGRLDVFDDRTVKTGAIDALDRIAGLYTGDLMQPVREARNGHAKATFVATRGLSIPEVTAEISRIYAAYEYSMVTPETACVELGIAVAKDADAAEALRAAIPPLPVGIDGISPEGVLEGALKEGIAITRRQFEREFQTMALRYRTVLLRAGKVTP